MQLDLQASFQLLHMVCKVWCMYIWINEGIYVFPSHFHNGFISDIFYKVFLIVRQRDEYLLQVLSYPPQKPKKWEHMIIPVHSKPTPDVCSVPCWLSESSLSAGMLWTASWKGRQEGNTCTWAAFWWGLAFTMKLSQACTWVSSPSLFSLK